MTEWLRQLAPREQAVLGAGALLAVLVVAWTFVWMPLERGTADLSESVAAKTRLLVDLRRAAELESTSSAGAATSSQNLMLVLDEVARPLGLVLSNQTLQEGGQALRLTLSDASFDALISWLIELQLEHGVAAATAAIQPSATGTSGLVRATLTLERS